MVYEPCYDDPPAAAEADDQAATTAEQVFPDYDQYEPGPFTIPPRRDAAHPSCPAVPNDRGTLALTRKFAPIIACFCGGAA